MFESSQSLINKYNSLKAQLYESDTLSHEDYAKLSKEIAGMEKAYQIAREYCDVVNGIKEAKKIISESKDAEMISFAKEELKESEEKIGELEESLKIALLPQDPNDDKNVYLEIRPAAGGDEASLFAQEMLRMYLMFASTQGWKVEIMDQQDNDTGGIKLAIVRIAGQSVYSMLKYESGVHRVQRIPETESQGRVHTSTVTVAVMPEVKDVEVHLDMNDVEIDTFAASSAGGQNANKNQTGVRLRHGPTGIIVTIADSKSQMHNKEKAFVILKAKLYQVELKKQQAEEKSLRGSQIGSGDRSEKIRTYNFPQDRVTDHRIKHSRSNLSGIMDGDILDLIQQVVVADQTEKIASLDK